MTPADDVDLDGALRDLQEIREQFAATSEVLISLGRLATDNDAVLGTIVDSACWLSRADAALIFMTDGVEYRLARSEGLSEEYVQYIDRHPLPADSDVGGGSTLWLALPVTGTGGHGAAGHAEPSTGGQVVVIVEDDPGSLELLTLHVEGLGAAPSTPPPAWTPPAGRRSSGGR